MNSNSKARRKAMRHGVAMKTAHLVGANGAPVREDPSNIQSVCPCCAKKRRLAFQRDFGTKGRRALKSLIDDGALVQIKASFSDASSTEHLWVKVLAVNLDTGVLTGWINNDPVEIRCVKYGDLVRVDLNEVEDCHIGEFK